MYVSFLDLCLLGCRRQHRSRCCALIRAILRSPAVLRGYSRNLANYRKFMEAIDRAGLKDFS